MIGPPQGRADLARFFRKVELGDHAIAYYEKPGEKFTSLRHLVEVATDRGEAVGYAPWPETEKEAMESLRRAGLDVEALVQAEQLELLAPEKFFPTDGVPNRVRTMRFFKDATEAAQERGFKGLTAAADIGYMLEEGGAEALLRFERILGARLDLPLAVVCFYQKANAGKMGGLKVLKANRHHTPRRVLV